MMTKLVITVPVNQGFVSLRTNEHAWTLTNVPKFTVSALVKNALILMATINANVMKVTN